ncbi:MAG: glutamate--tRNA ligase [Acidobacteria bacterium RIFCSPLOWO2_12_FULL_54_10]|nr:MAG: glutamate--tRNA ligase [Acidobacteria bacterium RIFCSPLOWO2_12_FULL_54_10]
MSAVRVRFAPSPTGYLHVGGARTALFNWLYARKVGGVFVLRIEDTDAERSSTEMVDGILDSLQWLGLNWDEGPFFQSQRKDLYLTAARKLQEKGFAYRCYCHPSELNELRLQAEKSGKPWKYDGRCTALSPQDHQRLDAEGRTFAVRFRVPQEGAVKFQDIVFGDVEFSHDQIEDFVLIRSDGLPTFHLSVVVDDIDMHISHVIRGADHLSNTPKHILLFQALDAPMPAFAHVPLILGPDRSRLSKRHGATAAGAYREMGILAEAMRNFLSLLGWSPGDNRELMRTPELIEAYSLEGISRSSAVFDLQKLEWFNSQYMQLLTAEELEPLAKEKFIQQGCWNPDWEGESRQWFLKTLELIKPRMRSLNDLTGASRAFFADDFPLDMAAKEKFWKDERLSELLSQLAGEIDGIDAFDATTAEQALRTFADKSGVKAGLLINAARVALTGQAVAPSLFAVMETLGKAKTVRRLQAAAQILTAPAS